MNLQHSFSFYSSVFSKKVEKEITLDELFQLTTGNLLAFKTSEVRRLTTENREEEAKRLKLELPTIAVAAHYQQERKAEKACGCTGFVLIDIDHSRRPPADVIAECRLLPYVAFACISVRGQGIHLLVKTDCLEPDGYKRTCQAVMEAIERLTGEATDHSCSDLARAMLINHDTQCYVNPDVRAFEMPVAIPSTSCPPRPCLSATDRLSLYLDKADLSLVWMKGCRHTTLASLAGSLNAAGFAPEEAIRECTRRYAQPDFGETEIRKTISSIYAAGQADFGRNQAVWEAGKRESLSLLSKTSGHAQGGEQISKKTSISTDIQLDDTTLPHFPQSTHTGLPWTVAKMISEAHTDREKDIDLYASLVLLSSVMPHVSGRLANETYHPTLFGVLIGESASGKGRIARLHRVIEPWQNIVYLASESKVQAYEQELREYDEYYKQPKKNRTGPAPVRPKTVKQMDLHMPGYVSAAKMTELLAANGDYAACMYETEMEGVVNVVDQDFGHYSDVLNKVYHHETLSSNTVSRGRLIKYRPQMSLFLTGTPGMFKRLVPNTENGTFSRLLIYKMINNGEYIPLSPEQESTDEETLKQLGQELVGMASFLYDHPTEIHMTNTQYHQINRFFGQEFKKNWVFGNEDRNSIVVRYRIALLRIAMTLSAIRKAEQRNTERNLYVSDTDFETSLNIVRICLQHAYIVSTSLAHRTSEVKHTFPYQQLKLFSELPEKFKRAEAVALGDVHGAGVSTIDRMLKKSLSKKLTTSLNGGYYQKTKEGLAFSSADTCPEVFDKDDKLSVSTPPE